jgi:hypothetical protein
MRQAKAQNVGWGGTVDLIKFRLMLLAYFDLVVVYACILTLAKVPASLYFKRRKTLSRSINMYCAHMYLL